MISHPIVDLWPRILEYGKNYSPSQVKEGNILREYLQNRILEKIFSQKISREIFFVGGTSLRILRGLDRFSEDLDFDLGKISDLEIKKIFANLVYSFQKENFPVEGYKNLTKKRLYFELRFPVILHFLGLSQNPKQKLVIKLDFVKDWKGLERQVILVEKYGFIYRANTLTKDQILSEKIHTYCYRQQTLARDLYDIVWLLKNGAKMDWRFLNKNSFDRGIYQIIKNRWQVDKNKIVSLKNSIQPLLINEENARQIYFFPFYFPEISEIEYQGVNEARSQSKDAFEFKFRFLVKKEKEVTFNFIVTGTARVKVSEEVIKKIAEKFFSFYKFNPAINYQTKMIHSYNLEDFLMAEGEELNDFLE